MLLNIPITMVLQGATGTDTIRAVLPWNGAGFLIIVSVVLTMIGGLIPSRKAANSDPVAALRSE